MKIDSKEFTARSVMGTCNIVNQDMAKELAKRFGHRGLKREEDEDHERVTLDKMWSLMNSFAFVQG